MLMQIDQAFQRLREVNPVSDLSSLREGDLDADLFLASTRERSTRMKAIETTETAESQSPSVRRGLGFAVATFAIVVTIGVGLWALSIGGSDADLAADHPALVDDFIEAFEDQDVERAVALFTVDATFHPGLGASFPVATGHDEMRDVFETAMSEFRIVEAYDFQQEGDLLTFDTKLKARGGPDELCQRNEMVVDNGKIGSWVVTLVSVLPCP